MQLVPRYTTDTYFTRMETLSTRLHRLLAAAMGAPPRFFDARIDRHCSNLQVANYPTIEHHRWGDQGGGVYKYKLNPGDP
jgi:isopenicillin N synthase-like dioxygenase